MFESKSEVRFESEEQFVKDMAQSLIRAHMKGCDSDTRKPSEAVHSIAWNGGEFRQAYVNHVHEERPELEAGLVVAIADVELSNLAKEACEAADRKWAAAMLLLGVE